MSINFSRKFAMPSPDTFSIKPIKELLDLWLKPGTVIADPFARNSMLGTLRNDLNPFTLAIDHEDAITWSRKIAAGAVDAVLFDPPYSPRQIKECYESIGLPVSMQDTQNARLCKAVKDAITPALKIGAKSHAVP